MLGASGNKYGELTMNKEYDDIKQKLNSKDLEEQREALSLMIKCNTPPDLLDAIKTSACCEVVFEQQYNIVVKIKE